MLNEETRRKLRELNIGELITAFEIQQQDSATVSLDFDERMQRIVDYLCQEKYNSKKHRIIKSAKFKFSKADIHSIYYDGRTLNKDVIIEAATCQFVRSNHSIVFQCNTGPVKTFLACYLGKESMQSPNKN